MSNSNTDPLDDATTDEHPDEAFSAAIEDDSTDANIGSSGAMTGPQDESYDPMELYNLQRHRNGDETAVLLCSFGNGYQVIALDVDAGGQLLEVDQAGGTPDRDKAVGMAEYWLDHNPDGVLGAGGDGGDGGLLSGLFGGDGT